MKKVKRKIVSAKEISVRKGVPEENIGAVSQAFHVQGDEGNDVVVTAHPISVEVGSVNNGIVDLNIKVKMLNHLFQKPISELLGSAKFYVMLATDLANLKEEVQIGVNHSTGDGIYYILDPHKPKSQIYDHINVVKMNVDPYNELPDNEPADNGEE